MWKVNVYGCSLTRAVTCLAPYKHWNKIEEEMRKKSRKILEAIDRVGENYGVEEVTSMMIGVAASMGLVYIVKIFSSL